MHRSRITNRLDYIKPWSLKIWKNPNKKFQVIKCCVCHPNSGIPIKKVGRILEFEDMWSEPEEYEAR